jgi:hypothetical protein
MDADISMRFLINFLDVQVVVEVMVDLEAIVGPITAIL